MLSKNKVKFKETEIGMIPYDWDIKSLRDISTIIMGQSPPSSTYNTQNRGLPFFQGRRDFGRKYPSVMVWCSEPKRVAKQGDVLLSVRAPIGDVNIANEDSCIGRGLASLSMNYKDNEFLYHLLVFNKEKIRAVFEGEGTVFGCVTKQGLNNFKVSIPSNSLERESIGNILSSLDEKIEFNCQMNKTLEKIGQALFKHWFIDFEFPNEKGKPYKSSGGRMVDSKLGEIPQGWKVKKVGEVIEIFGGTTPSTKEQKYWERGTIHWATPKDLSDLDSPVLTDTDRKITPEGLATISSGLLPAGTVLLSSRAPIGYTAISQMPVSINQGFIAMVCNHELPNYYVFSWVQYNLDIIKSVASGTTFEEVNKTNFRRLDILVPPPALLSKFSAVFGSLYECILNNSFQSRTLVSVRDSLLPKLMSGQIRVPAG